MDCKRVKLKHTNITWGFYELSTIYICVGSACYIKGSNNIIIMMQNLINEYNLNDKVVIKGSFCLGHCTEPVSVKVDDGEVVSINENNICAFFKSNIVRRYK